MIKGLNLENKKLVQLKVINEEGHTNVIGFVEEMSQHDITIMLVESGEVFPFNFADEDREDGQVEEVSFITDEDEIQEQTMELLFAIKNLEMSRLAIHVAETFKSIIDCVPEDADTLMEELKEKLTFHI